MASAYANVSSQFGDKFSTDLAGRYEHYQDFGSQWTGKLAARYAFAPAFALRGAISNNVRAPSLSQIGYEATSTGYDADGRLTQGRLLSVNNPIARGLGATDLTPEKSVNYSLGFTSKLGDHFDLSLDFSKSISTTASRCPKTSPATRSPTSSSRTSASPACRAPAISSMLPTPAPVAPSWSPTGASTPSAATCC